MQVLLLTSSMSAGGAERVASTLVNAWSARGDEVTLMPTFSGRGNCFYELSQHVRLVYLADLVSTGSGSVINKVLRFTALRRFISMERPDVIVSFLSNVNVAALVASAGLAIPTIVCERTDPFVTPISRLLRITCRLMYPLSDALMVQTQSVANKYARAGWPLKRLRVIPNPLPEEVLNVESHSRRRGGRRLLSIGRFDEGKQFDVLIKVFACLAKRHDHWRLRIIGDGPLLNVLRQQIMALGLEGRVELPGRSTNVGEELSQADAFVLTSRYEGFPNSLVEAMAVGLPCVAFDCPSGPREISMDGECALLVPLNDEHALGLAVERLMSDARLRQELGSRARASVIERFSLERVLGLWDLLFEDVGVKR